MIIEYEESGKFTLHAEQQQDGFFGVNFCIDPLMAKRIQEEFYKAERKFLKQKGFRKGKIPRKIMESKMGGEIAAYSASFTTYANIKLFEHSPRKVLYTKDYDIKNNEFGWLVTFKAWLEPQAEIPDNILDKKFEVPKLDVQEYVNYRLRAFSKTHPYLHVKESKAVEGDMVEVSIQATIDDKEFKDGSHESVNIRLIRDAVDPPTLFDKLINTVPGDNFIIETSNAQDIPRFNVDLKDKKLFKMVVSVLRVFECEESKIDDDLAITAGFDSLDKWKEHLNKSGEALTKGREEIRKKELLLEHLSDKVFVLNMPEGWAKEKVQECIKANLVPHDSPSVRDALVESAKHITILKAVGDKLKIKWDDEEKDIHSKNDRAYADKVLGHLLSNAQFVYVDPTPEDSFIKSVNE